MHRQGTPAQAATRLLLRQRLHSLRFDIMRLDFEQSIVFDTLQHYCAVTRATLREVAGGDARDGVTLVRRRGEDTTYIVLYNDGVRNRSRRAFTLAHEIGHIVLGHLDDGNRQEAEADAFASQLLMPRILVERLFHDWEGALTDHEIGEVFGVSRAAARQCLRLLRESPRYTEEDWALLQRFGPLLPGRREPIITI